MAKGFFTVADLSPELRRKGAENSRAKLRDLLSNPFLPTVQRKALEEQVQLVNEWEKGKSLVSLGVPPEEVGGEVLPRVGTNHDVTIQEDLSVDDSQS